LSDEGFREIQLNGKQLIFLFMAVTVVLVVTFLFGVLVGRGAREGAPQIATNEIAPALPPAADATAPPSAGAPVSQVPAGQTPAAPPAEELSYAERLLRDTPPEEHLKSSPARETRAATPSPAPIVQEPVAEKAAAPPPPPTPAPQAPVRTLPPSRSAQPSSVPVPTATAKATDPAGPGFAVQVAAYPDRRDAEMLVKQLVTKGYPAFVMDPVKGAPTKLFRVRVGKYPNRNLAESVQGRLVKSEQFTNAWIAR
jgi:cell division septation protein DedD